MGDFFYSQPAAITELGTGSATMRRKFHKVRSSGTRIQVSAGASARIRIVIGLILLGVAVVVWFSSDSMRVKGNAGVSPEMARYIFAGIPGGLGALLFLSGIIGLFRSDGGNQ